MSYPGDYVGLLDNPVVITDAISANHEYWYETHNMNACKGRLERAITQEDFEQIQREFDRREEKLMQSTEKGIEDFFTVFQNYSPAVLIIWAWDESVFARIKVELAKNASELETESLLDTLNIPLRNNYYKQEQYDLVTTRDIRKHIEEYAWILSRYGRNIPYTFEAATENKRILEEENYLDGYAQEKEDVKNAIYRAKEILGPKQSYLVDLMQYIVFYRTHRTDMLNKATYAYIPRLEMLADTFNLTYQELLHCMPEEITQRKIPPKKILQERIRAHSMVVADGAVRCVVGEDMLKIQECLKEDVQDVSSLTGTVASQGKISGPVKIIRGPEDFAKFVAGDIVVANMTTPDMMPILRKAGAFVTEEGGITCHAAIVSRELKKPCIIGTKIATKVLKDGMLVEVDADKGVVTILSKSK